MFRGADDDEDCHPGRPRRPSLTIRVAKHGAAPLHAFGCGLGRMIPCAPMTPVTPGGPMLRGRTESAPAQLEDDFPMSSMDESTLSGSRMSMSSIEESDSSAGTSVGSSPRSASSALSCGGSRRARAQKKRLRVSFASQLTFVISDSSSSCGDSVESPPATAHHPTPVPEDHAVAPGGQREDGDDDGDDCCDDMTFGADDMGDGGGFGGCPCPRMGAPAAPAVPGLSISLPEEDSPTFEPTVGGFSSAPSFGGANPFASAPMTAPAAMSRGRAYWTDGPSWGVDLTAVANSPRVGTGRAPPPAPIRVPSGSGSDSERERRSPVSKRKRCPDVALEDSCDADVEDGFDMCGDAMPPGCDDDL